jgi:hypothetical protein
MQIRVSPNSLQCNTEEWQARIDLGAAHRLAFMHGFSEGIFNHLTLPFQAAAIATIRSRSACIGPKSRPRRSWRSG